MTEQTIRVLPSDIYSITKRVFRAAQLPASYSISAAEMVRYAELYHGTGVTLLHRQLTSLEAGLQKRPRVIYEGEGVALMDGGGQHVFFSAPSALDLVCAKAEEQGIGVVSVTHTKGGLGLLEQLADRAAQRGLICLLVIGGSSQKDEFPHTHQTIIALPNPNAPLIFQASLQMPSYAHVELAKAVHGSDLTLSVSELLTGAFSHPTPENQLPLMDTFLFLCYFPHNDADLPQLEMALLQHAAALAAHPAADCKPKVWLPEERVTIYEQANQERLSVDATIWSEVKAFGERILVSTSS